jgi:UDP-N-acetylmuramoyl-L-alanyl-D-glutamate--2,6-diaminopimelate ligase
VADQPIRPPGVPGVSLASVARDLGIEIRPSSPDVQLTGVSISASATLPGDMFVALPGRVHHGASFASDALKLGAVAIVTDPAGADILGAADVALGVHPTPRAILGRVSQRVYDPGVPLPRVLSVTGTNGKTSVVFYLEAILRQLGEITALSNSTERRVAGEIFKTPLTTPEANELQALLAIGAQRGVGFFALEASAQAIERHRLDGIVAAVSGFTNLSHDHFEDYGNMDAYLEHKLPLFQPQMSQRAVVSLESSWGASVVARAGIPVVTISSDAGANATWSYRVEESSAFGETFEVSGPHGTLRTRISAIGEHMVRNTALAIAMVSEAGIEWERFSGIDLDHGGIDLVVPGRIERVSGDSPVAVFVDAGRSADAYSHTFESVRSRIPGKLIVVIGTSGDRDRSKRPIMGTLAAQSADLVIITDDDPRKEDPAQIRADLLEGARGVPDAAVEEIPEPTEAIRFAVSRAQEGDAVVWMGPGSQHYRDLGGVRVPFSARDEARRALVEAGWLSS